MRAPNKGPKVTPIPEEAKSWPIFSSTLSGKMIPMIAWIATETAAIPIPYKSLATTEITINHSLVGTNGRLPNINIDTDKIPKPKAT